MKFRLVTNFLICVFSSTVLHAQWQHIKGDSYDPILPKYGIQNQSHIYNSTGSRQGAATWTYNNEIYLLGGSGIYMTGDYTNNQSYEYNNGSYNDIWKYSPVSGEWTWIKGSNKANDTGSVGTIGVESPNNLPSSRANFSYWVVGNYLYVYSGDLWKYNMQTNNWTCLNLAPVGTEPVYGQPSVPGIGVYPNKRTGATCWTQGNYLYLFAGATEAYGNRNDVWRYDITTQLWTWLKGGQGSAGEEWGTVGVEDSLTRPGARTGMACEVLGDMVYIMGAYNQVWRYNMSSNNWCVKYGIPDYLVSSSDSLLINPNYGVQNVYSPNNSPGYRVGVKSWSKDGSLFLFGGNTAYTSIYAAYSHYHNDIWQFDTAIAQWRYIKGNATTNQYGKYGYPNIELPSNTPGSRSNMLKWSVGNNIYISNGFGYASSGASRLISDTWKYNTISNNWTWVDGSNNSSLSYVAPEVGVELVNNKPAPGTYAAFWNLDTAIYIMGRNGTILTGSLTNWGLNTAGRSADGIWKYNILTNNWIQIRRNTSETNSVVPVYGVINIADSANTPGTRLNEVTWQVGTKLYLLGGQRKDPNYVTGQTTDSVMNDLWEFDLTTRMWRWIKGGNGQNQAGVYGTLGVAATGNVPGARAEALSWSKDGKLYLFGGWGMAENGQLGLLNDLWEFNPVTNNWRWIHGSKLRNQNPTFGTKGIANVNNKPGGRYGSVCWVFDNKLYAFAGRGKDAGTNFTDPYYLSELWVYDLTISSWTWLRGSNSTVQNPSECNASYGIKGVENTTNRPPATIGSTGTVSNGKLILFGGTGFGGCSSCGGGNNNLWSYNPQNNNWTWLEGSGDANAQNSFPDTPVVQAGPVLPSDWKGCTFSEGWSYNNKFYLFGGTGYVSNNDIWSYKLCTVNPPACDTVAPVASLGPDTAICPGNYLELHSGNFGYQHLWSTGDTSQNIVVTQSGTYWIKVTNPSNGAVASDTIVVQVNPVSPTIAITATPGSSICAGNPVTFQATITNGGNAPAYQWKVNGTLIGTNLASYSSTSLTNGDIITCELTSSLLCASPTTASSNSLVMTVAPAMPLSVSITSSASAVGVCSGTNVVFTAVSVNGGASPSYQWKKNGSNVGTNSNTYSDNTLTSTDIITCMVSGSDCTAGSTDTSNAITTQVVTSVTPQINITTTNNTICAGQNASFTASVINGGSTPTYQWKVNGINAGTNSNTFSISTVNNGDVVTCTLASSMACITSDTVSSNSIAITVNPAVTPTVSISIPDTSICQGTAANFTTTAIHAGTTPSYQWKVNGNNVGINSPTFSISALNNGEVVSCVLTSNANCATTPTVNSNSITMTVNPSVTPELSITASANSACAGAIMQFSTSATITGTAPIYQWKVNNVPVGSNNSTFSSATLNNGDIVSCVLTSNATGCLTTTTATSNNIIVVINPMVSPSITINSANGNTVCQGTSVVFTASTTNAGISPVYQWKKNNNNVGIDLNTYTDATLTSGDVISCDVISNANCLLSTSASSNNITMTVMPTVTASVAISSTQTSICSGTNVIFTAATVNGGATPIYQWKKNGANVGANSDTYIDASLANGDMIGCDMVSSAICATPATVTSNNITMSVTPQLTPSIIITVANNQLCDNDPSATLNAVVVNEGTNPGYQWKKNGVNTGSNSNVYINPAIANGDVITCELASNASCLTISTTVSNAVSFTVNPSFIANSADSICQGETYHFGSQSLNSPGNYTEVWTTAGGCDSTIHLDLTVTPSVMPTISISAVPGSMVNNGQTVTFTAAIQNGGTAPAISWRKNNSIIPGANGVTWQGAAGTDFVQGDQISSILVSNAPCATAPEVQSANITMGVNTVGIRDKEKPEFVKLFPNPTSGVVIVKGLRNSGTIEIYDALGRKVFSKAYLPAGNLKLLLADYAAGSYNILFTEDSGKQWSQKVIRE